MLVCANLFTCILKQLKITKFCYTPPQKKKIIAHKNFMPLNNNNNNNNNTKTCLLPPGINGFDILQVATLRKSACGYTHKSKSVFNLKDLNLDKRYMSNNSHH